MAEEKRIDRRAFFKGGIISIVAVVGAGLSLPAIPYIVGPALKRRAEQEWIRLGQISKVEMGVPTLFKFKLTTQTGWIVSEQEVSAYVYTTNGRDFLALSNICTHLGCRVRWIAEKEQFFCPCHNGVFDKEGNVLGGPPPRPLDRFEIKLENDQLYIKGGSA